MSSVKPSIGVGIGVMVLKDNMVLLGKRNNDPKQASSLLSGAGKWTMPGGKVEQGETLFNAAKRELKEETGLIANTLELIHIQDNITSTVHFATIGFLCTQFYGNLTALEPDIIQEWQWFSLDKLPTLLYIPSKSILEGYRTKTLYVNI